MHTVVDRMGRFLAQLQSSDFADREKAVKELATFYGDEAIAGLVLALEDSDPRIRELAADSLGRTNVCFASQLLIRSQNHRNIETRKLVTEFLVRIGSPAVQFLLDALDDDDPDIRMFAVCMLGRIRDDTTVGALCERLSDGNLKVVRSAVEALGEIGSSKAIPALVATYEKIADVRLQVVEALGKIGDPAAVEALLGYLKADDPLLLCAVIEAVGNIGAKDSVETLREHLDSKDPAIAETALAAIINITAKYGQDFGYDLPVKQFQGFLISSIKNGDKKITEFILNRLTGLCEQQMVGFALDALDFVEEGAVKRILEALGKVGPSASELILERFVESTYRTKLILLDILGWFVDESIAGRLVDFVDDPHPEVRRKIAYTLGKAGWSGAAATLKKLATDEVGYVREAAFVALGWLCSERDVDFLLTGLKDEYSDVREAALGALVIISGPKVIAKLAADLYHHDSGRQHLAVTGLGLIGEREVIDPLMKVLNHPEPSIRKAALTSLARIGEITDIEPLKLALHDENSGVRKAAVSALITIQGERAVGEIRFLLDDKDVWVRYHTISSIGRLGFDKHSEYLLPYLEEEEDIVRIAATKAVAQMANRRVLPQPEASPKEERYCRGC